jgi:hypothetical protein
MTDTDYAAAAKKHAEDTKKKLAEERKARDEASTKHAKMVSETKPTPTQEENDLAASGVHIPEHEDDGSGPDPNAPAVAPHNKAMQADKPKPGYATKSV